MNEGAIAYAVLKSTPPTSVRADNGLVREGLYRAIACRVLRLRRTTALLRAIVAAFSLSLVSHGTASDGAAMVGVIDEHLVHELLDWIEDRTGHDVEGLRRSLPSIVLAALGDELRFGDESILITPQIGGLWNTETQQIVLVEPWQASAPIDLSILLHELVHAVQADAGGSVCNPDAEWEAYSLQVTWLAEHDVVMFVDWNEVLEHATCEEEVPP